MEVHAHTHPSTSSGHRKKWTHFFWEFLMLFLAVFCGFLAEYKLEHMIEHQRAKVYAENLYEELNKDTAALSILISRNEEIHNKIDTLCLYATEKQERNITNGILYYYANYTTKLNYFSSKNSTIVELKGSGNLRLMKSKVAHEISEYDKKIRELENEYLVSRSEFEKIESLYFNIFDGYITYQFTNGSPETANRDSIFKLNPPLINDDPRKMKEFIGWMKFESDIYAYQNRSYLFPLKKCATGLLALLKKEYHLSKRTPLEE